VTKRQWARYVRVSRVGEREGESFVSPAIQRRGVEALIRNSGGLLGPEFEDLDKTGTDFNREGIQAAIAWVLERPESRGLATYDVSRWARSTSEGLRWIKTLRAAGAVYGSSVERIDDTPEGNFALTQWLALAELDSARKARAWRAVHRTRVVDRKLPHSGTVPLGYTRDEAGLPVPCPETAGAVVETFERYARGETLKSVAARLGEVRGGGVHVPTQNAKRTLASRFYIGEVRYQGEWHPGAHQPIVPVHLWARVEFRLHEEAGQSARHAAPASLLTGLLRCGGCGGSVTLVNKGKERPGVSCTQFRKRYAHERTCEGIGAPRLDTLEQLTLRALSESCHAEAEQAPIPVIADQARGRVISLEAEEKTLLAGRTRIMDALSRGTMTNEAFDEQSLRLRKDLADVRARLAEAKIEAGVAPETNEDRKAKVRSMVEVFWILPREEARALLREIVRDVRVHRFSDEDREELGLPTGKFAPWEGWVEIVWR
jgi:site-specific DNA recombinase